MLANIVSPPNSGTMRARKIVASGGVARKVFVTVPDVRQRRGRARVIIEHDKLGHVLGVGRKWADGEFSKPTPERDLLLCINALIAKDQHFMLSKRGAYVVELGAHSGDQG